MLFPGGQDLSCIPLLVFRGSLRYVGCLRYAGNLLIFSVFPTDEVGVGGSSSLFNKYSALYIVPLVCLPNRCINEHVHPSLKE